MGTKKGQVRKTARRAYEPKGGGTNPRTGSFIPGKPEFVFVGEKARGRAKDRAAMLRHVFGSKAYARKSSTNIWKVFSRK